MRLSGLVLRNLKHFWRTNLAIVAGVAIAVSVISGALQVGQSVQASLRQLLFERIGSTDYLFASTGFFSENLSRSPLTGVESCPLIYLKGVAIHDQTKARANQVNVYGIDESFWEFHGISGASAPGGREALVGEPLARQLNLKEGEDLLLQVETQQAIPREWLYGRRENSDKTIRLRCGKIIPAETMGEFALRPSQGPVFTIFLPLGRLQKEVQQSGRINSILISGHDKSIGSGSIRSDFRKKCTLADLGLSLRSAASGKGFSLESRSIIIDDSLARAAFQAAGALGIKYSPIFTYLANSVRAAGKEIPYSVITAADLGEGAMRDASIRIASRPDIASKDADIRLTDWAYRDLGASIGDPVEVDYFLWQDSGQLVTRTARFRLAGVVDTSGDIDASLAPEIPGITEAASIGDWDPPFPLDLGRIRREDEDFWDRYKATPKAFIPLEEGQKLWANRFGNLTAIRLAVPEGSTIDAIEDQFSKQLLRHIDPQQFGLLLTSVREQGLSASHGSTDFGEYFLYFSFFLIAAALLLFGLFFKLMIEQRVKEIGILSASGYPVSTLRRIFLLEGLSLSIVGSILGLVGSFVYGWFVILGLRTFWVGAVGTRRLAFHASIGDLSIGVVAGILFSAVMVVWTLRGLRQLSPRMLLSGVLESGGKRAKRTRALFFSSLVCILFAAGLLAGSALERVSAMEAFFGSGFLLLIAILCLTASYLRSRIPSPVQGDGSAAFLRLALRNAMHKPARSIICASLIASATFIIISMEAFRKDPNAFSLEHKSGTGGYTLLGESAIPIIQNLNSETGRESTGISGSDMPKFTSFRERPGDDVSCLNLYAPQEPQILGATPDFIAAGRFSFQKTVDSDRRQEQNPWLLLESAPKDPVVPAIADANTIQYILHRSVGSELIVRGDRGTPVRLRLVASLQDSIFQGEILISEANFLRHFPDHQGYSFFLIEAAQDRSAEVRHSLQESLSNYGFSIETSQERLASYHRVENAYLSTFQSLGSLGLVLGTIGLAAILLRNVLERRQELAVLRAVGFRKRVLSGIILSENLVLICWGLAAGAVCAFVAIIPAIESRGGTFPFAASGLVLISVLMAGAISSIFAVVAALRSPLLTALRSE